MNEPERKTGHIPNAEVHEHGLAEFTLKSGRVLYVLESHIEGHAPSFVIASKAARGSTPFRIGIPRAHVRDLRDAIDEFLARDDARARANASARELPTFRPTPPNTGRGVPRGKVEPR